MKAFIQNVHHFRDECLVDPTARRSNTSRSSTKPSGRGTGADREVHETKRGHANFAQSEPEFLISCLDRHPDWAVVVCLVGGGQEINTGEAGIGEWVDCAAPLVPGWRVYISSRLTDSEYGAGRAHRAGRGATQRHHQRRAAPVVSRCARFAPSTSPCSSSSCSTSKVEAARETLRRVRDRYPIVLTRDLAKAKQWLANDRPAAPSDTASSPPPRPSASSRTRSTCACRWTRSSGSSTVRTTCVRRYYLEDVATEFHVQGLELDWACVTWDGDFRYSPNGWEHWRFVGDRWNRIRKPERQTYLKNAYRVLLTRARQGMVIVVPPGGQDDHTRKCEYYDRTFDYLAGIGFATL